MPVDDVTCPYRNDALHAKPLGSPLERPQASLAIFTDKQPLAIKGRQRSGHLGSIQSQQAGDVSRLLTRMLLYCTIDFFQSLGILRTCHAAPLLVDFLRIAGLRPLYRLHVAGNATREQITTAKGGGSWLVYCDKRYSRESPAILTPSLIEIVLLADHQG